MSVEVLVERERAKRLLVIGALAALYTLGWLFFSWRASRIGESECTVVRVPSHTYCTVSHVLDGKEHTLPWEDCTRPTRWPNPSGQPAVIGKKLHCYFYRSFPDDIFFEPRQHRWFGPFSLALLFAALAACALGTYRWIFAERRVAPAPPPATAYRAAASVSTDSRPPLRVSLVQGYWWQWLLGAPFAILGIALVSLSTLLGWQFGGELGIGSVLIIALGHGTTLAGAIPPLYRSGLVFDPERGLVFHWWGLKRPLFYGYASFTELGRVGVVTKRGVRSSSYYLALYFSDGTIRKYARLSREEAEAEVGRIEEYLWPDADRRDSGSGNAPAGAA